MSRRQKTSASFGNGSGEGSATTHATNISPSGPISDNQYIRSYYNGIPGRPKLLARCSEEPLIVLRDDTFPTRKQLYNVGSHRIVGLFDNGPREDIRKILYSHDIPWFTVNVVRLGYSDIAAQNPVVLLVTVEQDTNVDRADNAALDCWNCLAGYQLGDVHVELMEMLKAESYPEYASSHIDDYQEVSYKLVPPIGASIGPRLDGEYQGSGSLGLYVQVKPSSAEHTSWRQCVLTCHHVVFPRGADPPPNGPGSSFHRENGFRRFVDSPSLRDHESNLDDIILNRMGYQSQIDVYSTRRILADQGMDRKLNPKELNLLQGFETHVAKLSEELEVAVSFNRGLGEVMATSGIKTTGGDVGLLDWALIELDITRFPNDVKNSVPPIDFSRRDLEKVNKGLLPLDRLRPDQFELDVLQIIPLSEINSPQVFDTNGSPSYRILKHGRSTGWSVGLSNEIRSDVQRESGVISREWCILDTSVIPYSSFSLKGDSGSFVFDYKGRLGGMVHGGDDCYRAPMTYVTHIGQLFESINEEFEISLL